MARLIGSNKTFASLAVLLLLVAVIGQQPCAAQFYFKNRGFVPNLGKRANSHASSNSNSPSGGSMSTHTMMNPVGGGQSEPAAMVAAAAAGMAIDGAELFELADLNRNGVITPGEFAAFIVHNIPPALLLDTVFALVNQEGNGRMSKQEFDQFLSQLINRKE